MRSLITGVNGFAGSHLADLLLAGNEEVAGVARDPGKDGNIRHVRDRVRVVAGDVRDAGRLKQILRDVRPDRIYHLASVTFLPAVSGDWRAAFETVFFGTQNLLEAVKETRPDARVLWVGSSEEYGLPPPEELPVRETCPLRPISLYGAGKAAAEALVHSYVQRDTLDVVLARPFNHIGPRQDGRFACASFARQVAAISAGTPPVLKVGNLQAQRDFTDARDTVRAYRALMEFGKSGEVYNVCSGQSLSVQSLLDGLLKLIGVAVKVEIDPERYRPEAPSKFYGDYSRLNRDTGWRPEISLETTLRDLLRYWQNRAEN
ncbi:MAG: GDP-mannose 4,6-dehydratase [Nitrospinae bacterium]|nr:GDP-mannose 4,6-dehydratase [Nitrospinota bacterium]